jgi:hypothetical protein
MELSDIFKIKGLEDIKHQVFLDILMNRESHFDGIIILLILRNLIIAILKKLLSLFLKKADILETL